MEQEREKRNKDKRRRKRILFLIFLFCLILIFVYLWKKMQEPSTGKIFERTTKEEPVVIPEIKYQEFEGKYVSFRLPTVFVLKSHQDSFDGQGVLLESVFFADGELSSEKVALTVENIAGRSMRESADYNLRIKNPKKYQKQEEQVGDVLVTSFFVREGGGYEKVFFIPRGDFLAQMALTSPDSQKKGLDKEILEMAQSLKWKK